MTRTHRPLRRRITVRLAALTAALTAAAATVLSLGLAAPAGAIAAAQSDCLPDNTNFFGAGFIGLTARALSVSVKGATTVKAEATADVSVPAGAEVRLAWSVNGGTPQEGTFGPANFANHTEFAETRSTFGLIPVAAGTTTIRPFLRISGPNLTVVSILHRCATVEASTS